MRFKERYQLFIGRDGFTVDDPPGSLADNLAKKRKLVLQFLLDSQVQQCPLEGRRGITCQNLKGRLSVTYRILSHLD